jgi:hypothetical protein
LEGFFVIIFFPCDPTFSGDVQVFRRSNAELAGEYTPYQFGDIELVRVIDTGDGLEDGDYLLVLYNPNALFCCRVENQVAQVADFWPQLDMLRAMRPGKAYNWTNQANEVLRVAIEEAS